MRAWVSVPPPGLAGTVKVTVSVGQLVAGAVEPAGSALLAPEEGAALEAGGLLLAQAARLRQKAAVSKRAVSFFIIVLLFMSAVDVCGNFC